jgi:hypothetical protein
MDSELRRALKDPLITSCRHLKPRTDLLRTKSETVTLADMRFQLTDNLLSDVTSKQLLWEIQIQWLTWELFI